jgi:hypothetical protein
MHWRQSDGGRHVSRRRAFHRTVADNRATWIWDDFCFA